LILKSSILHDIGADFYLVRIPGQEGKNSAISSPSLMPLSVMASSAMIPSDPAQVAGKNAPFSWGGRSTTFDYLSMNNKNDCSSHLFTFTLHHISGAMMIWPV
jgi:hypothetical protein